MDLLEPITFNSGIEADSFIASHDCALCLSFLYTGFNRDGIHWVKCPNCGDVFHGTVVLKSEAEKVRQSRMSGDRLLHDIDNPKPSRSVDEILKDLGF